MTALSTKSVVTAVFFSDYGRRCLGKRREHILEGAGGGGKRGEPESQRLVERGGPKIAAHENAGATRPLATMAPLVPMSQPWVEK